MNAEQLLEDVARAIRVRDTIDEFAMARAALAVAIEACAKEAGKTRLGWTQEMQMVALDAESAIRALKPKD